MKLLGLTKTRDERAIGSTRRWRMMQAMVVMLRAWMLVLFFVLLNGCAAQIVPPANPPHSRKVLVADYGRHSSLILPIDSGHLIEFTYGDWDWFALGNKGVYRAFEALFFSPQATLGVRILNFGSEAPDLTKGIHCQRVLQLAADSDKVQLLRTELAERFIAQILTVTYDKKNDCYFVKDDEHYALWHNCNHLTARWLMDLGCEIQGCPVRSNFKLASP